MSDEPTPNPPQVLQRSADYERKRDQDLRGKYGISLERYRKIETTQKGLCKLCDRPPRKLDPGDILQVDHDHRTGKVRGLLCRPCNTFVGKLEKYRKELPKFWAYIDRHHNQRRSKHPGCRRTGTVFKRTSLQGDRWVAQASTPWGRVTVGTFASPEAAWNAIDELVGPQDRQPPTKPEST